jgi:hypothetical protein
LALPFKYAKNTTKKQVVIFIWCQVKTPDKARKVARLSETKYGRETPFKYAIK